MNFCQQLEDALRDLATEARKQHPGVKEASERATLQLRTLQSQYVSAVRQASKDGAEHPTTRLFQSSDLLHPFLLAANYPNASPKLLQVAFRAMRLLMEANAIVPTDGIHLVRVWTIQAAVVGAYYEQHNTSRSGSSNGGGGGGSTKEGTEDDEDDEVGVAKTSGSAPALTSSSSWFSWGTSSSSVGPTTGGGGLMDNKTVKNAVSSSSGQTGQTSQSATVMEKLALEILSSLVQLIQVLQQYPDVLQVELWTSAVSLCTLWFGVLPPKHTVFQAARSTVTQVVFSLYASQSHAKLQAATWQDLLAFTGQRSNATTKGSPQFSLQGAFKSKTVVPIPPDLALELLTTLLREGRLSAELSTANSPLVARTLSVTLVLLQKRTTQEKTSRTLAWTTAVLQRLAESHPAECRELWGHVLKYITTATEACRSHHDFEDGFVYNISSSSNNPKQEDNDRKKQPSGTPLLCLVPSQSLGKAAVALEAIVHLLEAPPTRKLLDTEMAAATAEALSDFCTICASCRDHILAVVQAAPAASTTSFVLPPPDTAESDALGPAVWMGLKGLGLMASSLSERPDLLQDTFAPLLAVLQHYLKRFVACQALIEWALQGYQSLADVCCMSSTTEPDYVMQRKALQTSLSKLSLPSWGKHDAASQLQDHHVRSLICLLRIVHIHAAIEWDLLLWTLQELSLLAIASPLLSDQAYHAALAVAAVYARVASFSTSLTEESLLAMTAALAEICEATFENRDVVGDAETVVLMAGGSRRSRGSMLVRKTSDDMGDSVDTSRTKDAFYDEYRREFTARMSASSSSSETSNISRTPFCLALFADVALANVFRSRTCGARIFEQLSVLAASTHAIRPFVTHILTKLILTQLSDDPSSSAAGPAKIVLEDPMQSQLLAVEPIKNDNPQSLSQSEILRPLCQSILTTKRPDVSASALGVLNAILEESGHHLKGDVWIQILDAIGSQSGGDFSMSSVDRSSPEWSSCGLLAFACLKLIVNDFLNEVPSTTGGDESQQQGEQHSPLIDCCARFVTSQHDVNTSLTAITLVWTIADQDSGTSSFDLSLAKLVKLVSDGRAEVRNAAVNTLFSCIAGRGASFDGVRWESCINGTIFAVYDLVANKAAAGASNNGNGKARLWSRYKVMIHDSRDSEDKQWVATQVQVLRGLTRVLRAFFAPLLDTFESIETNDEVPWFQDAWVRILDVAFDAAGQQGGRESIDIRSVGVDLLVVCAQLASKEGIHASATPARVGTNMEVVNGALRSVRETQARTIEVRTLSQVMENARERLFLEAFESLESFEEVVRLRKQSKEGALDDTDLQILQRFCASLSKLYDCCKSTEFAVDNAARSLRTIDSAISQTPLTRSEDDLEARYVAILTSMLKQASGNPAARFLNQAQRGAFEPLKKMALSGSSEACCQLCLIAGQAFFSSKDGKGGDEQHSLVQQEAAVAVSEASAIDDVSDECKLLVLFNVLDVIDDTCRIREEKRVVPVLVNGVICLAHLEGTGQRREADFLWSRFFLAMSILLTPDTPEQIIPGVSGLIQVVTCSKNRVPPRFRPEMCIVLSTGAASALDSVTHSTDATLREASLNLFRSCFSTACSLHPQEGSLRVTSRRVLERALADDDLDGFFVDVALEICTTLCEQDHMESLVVSVFGLLCRLIASPHTDLRDAASRVFTTVDLSNVLQSAQSRAEAAEDRASQAESNVVTLTATVEELRQDNARLRREVAVLESSTTL